MTSSIHQWRPYVLRFSELILSLAVITVAASSWAAAPEECTVSSAQELYEKLKGYYDSKSKGNTIYLEPGPYDISSYTMGYFNNNGVKRTDAVSHLSLYYTRLVGKGVNPRDVVIYGDRSNGIFVNTAGELCNLTISNGCHAAVGGGVYAITCSGDVPFASNVVVTCCKAEGKNGGGANGGTWVNCQFVDNAAKNGAGICGGVCTNCVICGNTATAYGGGAYCVGRLVACQVLTNKAVNGGGVYGSPDGFSHVTGGVIEGNVATGDGGGAYYTDFHGDTVVRGNQAKNGGGIWSGQATDQMSGNVIDGTHICFNTATQSGGGVYLNDGKCRLSDSVVSNNCADGTGVDVDVAGGGVYSVSGALVSKTDVVFNYGKNDAGSGGKSNYGGGIYGGTVTNCLIAGNALYSGAANVRGGGAYGTACFSSVIRDNYVEGSSAALNAGSANSCVISNNASWSYDGGTVRQAAYLRNCDICGTVASASLLNCRFVGYTNGYNLAEGANVAKSGWFRGYQHILSGASCATNCLFAGNDVNRHVNGSIFYANAASDKWKIVNCTVVDNESNTTISFSDSMDGHVVEVKNSIFTRNTNKGAEQNMMYANDTAQRIDLVNNVIGPGRSKTPVRKDVNTMPVTAEEEKGIFVEDGSYDNYALARKANKARNTGLVEDWMTGAFDIRGEGYPRLRDNKVDVGCYQCWLPDPGLLLIVR